MAVYSYRPSSIGRNNMPSTQSQLSGARPTQTQQLNQQRAPVSAPQTPTSAVSTKIPTTTELISQTTQKDPANTVTQNRKSAAGAAAQNKEAAASANARKRSAESGSVIKVRTIN